MKTKIPLITVLIVFLSLSASALTLNFKNMQMSTLIDTVSQITGKNFIVDPRVKGRINVVTTSEIDNDELYHLFLSILQVHGYIVVEGEEFSKILPATSTKNNSARISKKATDDIITVVIPIKNVAANLMISILRPIVSKYGHLATYAPSNTIIAIDTKANIARLRSIIVQLDKEIDEDYELIPLENISAAEVVKIIKLLIPTDKKKTANPLTIAIDKNNNQLVVGGAPGKRLKVRYLLKQLDKKPTRDGNTSVIYLKYANAKDILGIIQNIGKQLASDYSVDKAKKQVVNIQADEATNSIIITASSTIYNSVKSVISKLDIRRSQILIEAIIAEVSVNTSERLGVDWIGGNANGGGVGFINLSGSGLVSGLLGLATDTEIALATQSIITTGNSERQGIVIGGGGSKRDSNGKTTSGFAAVLHALSNQGDVNILSTPSIVTIDNTEATIFIGEEVSVITKSEINNNRPFNEYERKPVGIELIVKPQINDGDTIQLEIKQNIDQISGTGEITPENLRISKRKIDTTVMVENNKILVLGGLINDQINSVENKVPLLGDIPLLGNLFKYKSDSTVKQNLLVFIHPTIITDQDVADRISVDKYQFIKAQRILKEIEDQRPGRTSTPITSITPATQTLASTSQIVAPEEDDSKDDGENDNDNTTPAANTYYE